MIDKDSIMLLPTIGTNKKRISYLIDTGSSLSIIKRQCLLQDSIDIYDTKLDISGIVKQSLPATGSLTLKINLINDYYLVHQFHIVDEINLP